MLLIFVGVLSSIQETSVTEGLKESASNSQIIQGNSASNDHGKDKEEKYAQTRARIEEAMQKLNSMDQAPGSSSGVTSSSHSTHNHDDGTDDDPNAAYKIQFNPQQKDGIQSSSSQNNNGRNNKDENAMLKPQIWHDIAMNISGQSLKLIQQTYEEYSAVALTISANTPCNVLVFGCGSDSYIYYSTNRFPGSRTIFLEDVPTYMKYVRQKIDNDPDLTPLTKKSIELRSIEYTTNARNISDAFLKHTKVGLLQIRNVTYDRFLDSLPLTVILVDAPWGHVHGRSQSMYVARKLARHTLLGIGGVTQDQTLPFVHVFVHDVNRWSERVFADLFFGRDKTKYTYLSRHYDNEIVRGSRMNHMRYYKLDKQWAIDHPESELDAFFSK